MLRRLALLTAIVLLLAPRGAAAQKGPPVFDFLVQEAQRELQRQQQRQIERQQRQEADRLYQQFLGQWQACHAADLAACEQALAYANLSFDDRQRLLAKQAEIRAAQREAERTQIERRQAEIEELRQREHKQSAERDRQLARERADAERERIAAETGLATMRQPHMPAAQPPTSAAAPIWVVLLAFASIGLGLALAQLPRCALGARLRQAWDRLSRDLSKLPAWAAALAVHQPAARTAAEPSLAAASVAAAAIAPSPPAQSSPREPRDTPGAIAALELAHAYIEEVRQADLPDLEDTATRRQHLNTLALASRQLDAAQSLDEDAVVEGRDQNEIPYRFAIHELKAEALLLEGLTHQVYDVRRAIPALLAATKANPNHAHAFYVLGLTHAANRNKGSAVAALQRAVALEPRNIIYRKELNRAESLTAAEIAGYKATRAGERIFDAGIKTANAGILAWNVFAVAWNIATFPVRVVLAAFRLLRLPGFH